MDFVVTEELRMWTMVLGAAGGAFFLGAEVGTWRERKFIKLLLDRLGLRVLDSDGRLKRREDMEITFHLDRR